MLDYVSDFDIFCWRSKNMLYFLENRAWNRAFEKPLLMLRRFFENPPVLPWTLRNLRKPTSPPLALREGPPLSPSPFPLRVQGMYQPPYSVLKPLRYKVGGPSEVYASSRAAFFCAGIYPPCGRAAVFCAGMNPPCWYTNSITPRLSLHYNTRCDTYQFFGGKSYFGFQKRIALHFQSSNEENYNFIDLKYLTELSHFRKLRS